MNKHMSKSWIMSHQIWKYQTDRPERCKMEKFSTKIDTIVKQYPDNWYRTIVKSWNNKNFNENNWQSLIEEIFDYLNANCESLFLLKARWPMNLHRIRFPWGQGIQIWFTSVDDLVCYMLTHNNGDDPVTIFTNQDAGNYIKACTRSTAIGTLE